ncbi:MAG: bifunctional phosphopantothenoylcysteine decarboxylase/phosphopantothenate--cysteine ligase CoaBC [Terriglobia bacterium]
MRVALGVTGGIAAYKAAELVRLLKDRGIQVQVIMTRSAREFLAPLTFAALSGEKVITGLFEPAEGSASAESAIEHIAVAQGIDALVIAPATADVLAKLAHGIADDFLTTTALATTAPLIVAPAMNVYMWQHAATQANAGVLRSRGVRIVEPEPGELACGMVGPGRLAGVETIAEAVCAALGLRDDLRNETVLVTAGPTLEPIDPVRYLSNRSSGKMGYALAEASRRRGARVVLVSGPTHLDPPDGVLCEQIQTAEEMADRVLHRLDEASIVLMAAAVGDFQPESVNPAKIKKSNGNLTITLKPARDILTEIAARRLPGQLIVGFAAETERLLENAGQKLRAKGADMIVANDVTQEGAGFGVETNIVTLLFPDGRRKPLEKMSKLEVAGRVLDEVVELRKARLAADAAVEGRQL